MSNLSGAAYEYSRFEEKEKEKVKIQKVAKQPKKQTISVKSVICVGMIMAMLSTLIYTRVIQTELNAEYNKAVAAVNFAKDENSRLQIKLEQTLSPANIEAVARGDLQMQELDNSMIEYIEFNSEAKAEVLKEQSFFDSILNWIQGWFN